MEYANVASLGALVSARRLRKTSWTVVIAVVVLSTAMRFYRTAETPPGFYRDEAAVSANVICLAQAGRTLDGTRWPLMTPILGGGHSSVVWQAPAVVWVRIAGTSIAAMRSFAAVCGTLTVVGVFFFGCFATGSKSVGAYASVAAAVSPWAFQFSRIAWDAAISPCYLTWALAFLCLSTTSRVADTRWLRWLAIALSALLFAAACIAYPPLRAQVPLVLLAFLIWKRAYVRAHPWDACLFVVILAAAMARLASLTISGEIQGRFNQLSVFNAAMWAKEGITSPAMIVMSGLRLFAKNLIAHFTPTYLFLSGDGNLRHSTQSFGEWSWLDGLAIAIAAALASRKQKALSGWVAFAAFGYVAAVVAASLTTSGIPQALRSIGAIPFLAVLVGTSIDSIADNRPNLRSVVPAAAAIVATMFMVALSRVFFTTYSARAVNAFDVRYVQRLVDPDSVDSPMSAGGAGRLRIAYPLPAIRYYELSSGRTRCSPSADVLRTSGP